MTTRNNVTPIITIIGGGISGGLTAYHLLRQKVRAQVRVVDPRPQLGLGLAYSTPSLRHLLNVPAGKISALPDQTIHFLNWLRTNYNPQATEHTFAPRAVYGRYIQSVLAGADGVEQVRATVVNYQPADGGAVLTLDDGRRLHANLTVLAVGNFAPAMLPNISESAIQANLYCHNAWSLETYERLAPDAPVTLIGTGLTAVDVVLRLRELGHRGVITTVSRHGVFSNRHAGYTPMTASAIPSQTPATCIAYLRALRAAIQSGIEWRAAIDSLHAVTNDLWLALPLPEQKRFRRHLQRRWDVVRHRMAPPVADLIDAEIEAGTLRMCEGSFIGLEVENGKSVATYLGRHGRERVAASRVINCTGPDMNYRRVESPLLKSLFRQGLISSGPLGGGFRCTEDAALVDAEDRASETLFNLGPGRLGTLLESIAVPEIRNQAVALSQVLRRKLEERGHMQPQRRPHRATAQEVSPVRGRVTA